MSIMELFVSSVFAWIASISSSISSIFFFKADYSSSSCSLLARASSISFSKLLFPFPRFYSKSNLTFSNSFAYFISAYCYNLSVSTLNLSSVSVSFLLHS